MPNTFHIIGLMSGTSLDGLDLAYCRLEKSADHWSFELLASANVDYDEEQREKLQKSVLLPAEDLLHLDILYGRWLGEQVKAFITENNIQQIDAIASHGHTIFHQPEKGFTYQMGNGQELANYSGQKIICDFRSLDVAMGGQGAPLVPIGDQELFGDYDFCLNLGGISNVSFQDNGQRSAYDIGPANMLLNYLSKQVGMPYDKGGRIARGGSRDHSLLAQLDELAYYQLPFPKSLGFEWFVAECQPIIDASEISVQDKLCTATHHVVDAIVRDVKKFAEAGQSLLVTGGGAKNSFLIDLLTVGLHPQVEVVVPDVHIIDYKEAIVFALMGALKLSGENNCLASVTGARVDVSGGRIFNPLPS